MKSDPHFYKIFKACPELFAVFAAIDPEAVYTFDSKAFKAIDRTCDGVFESKDPRAPTYIAEFQGWKDPSVYPRILFVMTAYQLEHPRREVRSILIFTSEECDPKPKIWWDFSQTCGQGFRVVYLDEIIRGLPRDHPLAATFKPLLEKQDDVLQNEASQGLQDIRKADLQLPQKETLEEVYLSWLTQRFEQWTRKEIRTMFGFNTPVEETVFYKEVFHEGKLEGELKTEIKAKIGAIERLNKEVAYLRDLYERNYLPKDVFGQKWEELEAERAQLESTLEELKLQLSKNQSR